MRRWRSPEDREILRLAAPALGALAAGPLYVLVDTAIVGHLGTVQLAALALAGTIVATVTQLSDFLSYGTTAQIARLHGAGRGAGGRRRGGAGAVAGARHRARGRGGPGGAVDPARGRARRPGRRSVSAAARYVRAQRDRAAGDARRAGRRGRAARLRRPADPAAHPHRLQRGERRAGDRARVRVAPRSRRVGARHRRRPAGDGRTVRPADARRIPPPAVARSSPACARCCARAPI